MFDGTVSSANCNLEGGWVYDTVRVVNGYAGTVTLLESLNAENFVLDSMAARVSQPYEEEGDIFLTGSFTWTGGVLNSSENLSNVVLSGATATITPPSGAALVTGSTLSFGSDGTTGSTGTFNPGTVQFNNESTYAIGADSEVTMDMTNGDIEFDSDAADPVPAPVEGVVLFNGANVAGRTFKEDAPLLLDGGRASLYNKATVELTGALPADKIQYRQQNKGNNVARTIMEGGTRIKTAAMGVIELREGVLDLKVAGIGDNWVLDGEVWFGNVSATSPALTITSSDPGHPGVFVSAILFCFHDAWMEATSVEMRVKPNSNTCDSIIVSGKLTLGSYNRIAPNPGNVAPPWSYLVIKANGRIAFDEDENPGENLPEVDNSLWTIELQQGVDADYIKITSISD